MAAWSPFADPSPLLRPALFVAVAAAHVGAFGYASWTAQPLVPAPRLSIEVTLASPPPAVEAAPAEEAVLQEAPTETPPVDAPPPEPAPVDPPPLETPPEPAPEPLPEPPPEPVPQPAPEPLSETPPEVVPEPEPEPEPPAVVTATPPPRPDDVAPFVAPPAKPVVRKKAEVRKPIAKPKPRVAKPAPPRVRAAPQTAGSNSRAPASVASTTQYGAVISAAIRARTVFPQSARGAGGGVVRVTFVIGPAGRTQSASVTGSSGDPALDRAALAAVRGVSAPPPPGGRYSATQAIRFSLQ